jgi:hypothetical protein
MNPRWIGILLIVAGIVILLFSLSGSSSTVSTGEEFILRIGQTVSVEGEDLKITFSTVSGDSRCPADAVCIQAGEVACLMKIEQDGEVTDTEFAYPGLTSEYSRLTYQEHNYSFKVEPYPYSDKQIADKEYRLFLTVD